MALKDMTVREMIGWRSKKVIIELTSVKFWGACFIGYLNAHIVFEDERFDLFGMGAFLLLLGIRQASKLIEAGNIAVSKKQNTEGGDTK